MAVNMETDLHDFGGNDAWALDLKAQNEPILNSQLFWCIFC